MTEFCRLLRPRTAVAIDETRRGCAFADPRDSFLFQRTAGFVGDIAMRFSCFTRALYKTGDSQLSHPFRYAMSFAGPLDRHIRLLRQEAAFTKRIPAERVCGAQCAFAFIQPASRR